MDTATGPYLKDALVALAGVSVIVWTGVMVLKTVFRAQSTWGLIAAMDLLQASFMTALLALAVPIEWARPAAITWGVAYFVNDSLTLLTFTPLRTRFPKAWREFYGRLDATRGVEGRAMYAFSVVLFLGFVAAIAIWPSYPLAFTACFAWLFVGLQAFLTGFHLADPQK